MPQQKTTDYKAIEQRTTARGPRLLPHRLDRGSNARAVGSSTARRTVGVALLAMFALWSGALGQEAATGSGRRLPGIAAIVGEEVITWGDLDERVEQVLNSQREPLRPSDIEALKPRIRRDILEQLIDESVQLQEAKRLGLTAEDADIAFEIKDQIVRLRELGINLAGEEEFYTHFLEKQNTTREQIRSEIRRAIQIKKLLWTQVFTTAEFISPGELREYYQSHREEFQTPSEITFRQLLLLVNDDTPAIMEVINRALDEGIDFVKLVKRFSDCGLREEGGLWERKIDEIDRWPSPLPATLKAMKPGEIVRDVRTVRGIHYLKMEAITLGDTQPFEEVQSLIQRTIREQRRAAKRREYIDGLRKSMNAKSFLPEPEPLVRDHPTGAAKSGAATGAAKSGAATGAAKSGAAPGEERSGAPGAAGGRPAAGEETVGGEKPPPGGIRDVSPDPVKKKDKQP